jgi:hypothetical protein
MDSIDAQCLVVDLFDARAAGPPFWRHDRDGTLHYRFDGSPRSYSWEAEAVTAMAEEWRTREPPAPPPASIARHVTAHLALISILTDDGREAPDSVVHDLDAGEVSAVWNEAKLVVILELDGPPVHDQLRAALMPTPGPLVDA